MEGTMASLTYQIFREAILRMKQVTCVYRGLRREVCPHTLGYTAGHEQALTFQFAGQSASGFPPGGEWRCMILDEVRDAAIKDGPWHTANTHGRPQTCVKQVDVEVAH